VRADLLHRLQLLGREHHVLVLREFDSPWPCPRARPEPLP
jgi:hypothetical protein